MFFCSRPNFLDELARPETLAAQVILSAAHNVISALIRNNLKIDGLLEDLLI